MMSKQNKIVTPTPDEVTNYGTGPATPEGAPAGEPEDTVSAGTGAPEGTTRSEADEWREKLLRAKAELSNYQKRAEKDRVDAIRYANADMARALLPLVDDLDRVLASVTDANAPQDVLVQGVRLTRDNFLKVLQQFHVLPIVAQGELFDPNVHEALMQQPSAEHAEPTVLQEVARGYRLHDRVLRPAKVIVSKAPSES